MVLMKSSRRGLSMIEVLVAITILGLVAVIFNQFMSSAIKGQKNVQNAVEFDTLKSNITLVLAGNSCNGAFQNADGSHVSLQLPATSTWLTLTTNPAVNVLSPTAPLPVQKIVQGSSTIVSINQNLGGGMVVEKLEFTEATYDGIVDVANNATPPVTTPYRAFTAQLLLGVKKQAGSYGAPSYTAQFGVKILVNPLGSTTNGKIQRCGVQLPESATRTFVVQASASALTTPTPGPPFGNPRVTIPNPFNTTNIIARMALKAKTTEANYQVGEEIPFVMETNPFNLAFFYTVTPSSIYIHNKDGAKMRIFDKNSGEILDINPNNWDLKLYVTPMQLQP